MSASRPTRLFPVGEVSRAGTSALSASFRRSSTPTATTSFSSSSTLIDVSHCLRPRDYAPGLSLDEHATLTTDQLTALLFISAITCRHRLTVLRSFGFVERFIRRNEPGTPNIVCWVPGSMSARLTALAIGQNPPTARALRERQDRVYVNPALEHLLESNEFFVQLLAHRRSHQDTSLRRWWWERATAGAFGRRIHPDGHGVWTDGEREIGFFLELDRGTEPLGRLGDKLSSYRRLRAEGGPPYAVLFVLPSRTREQNLHRRLAGRPEPGLVVATTSPEAGDDPGRAGVAAGRQRPAQAALAICRAATASPARSTPARRHRPSTPCASCDRASRAEQRA
jgi:hypothetical protein